ncbi:hypothetical protein D3C87_960310 [compost metagenome]
MSSTGSTSITLTQVNRKSIPLGIPGQLDGRPTLQSDRGDETQRQFSYQCMGGVAILCGAVAGLNDYQAVWMEHHDDLLADCGGGRFDAIQSKTSGNAGAFWRCSDEGFIDAVKKHCGHHVRHGDLIRYHIIFSNIRPYVPASTAVSSRTLGSSPMRLVDECNRSSSFARMEEPYKASLTALSYAVGHGPKVVFKVMRKLRFQKGPQMEAFSDQVATLVAGVPECSKLPHDRLEEAGMNLYHRLHSASILNTSTLALQASQLAPDGRELAVIEAKNVTLEEARQILLRHPGENFLYDNNGMLQLGRINSQKDVLRRKMTVGGVGGQFTSVWLQAIAAEKRLMEEVLRDAKGGLKKLAQLEAVMIVECQNAEVESGADPESVRGQNIYRRILERTSKLSNDDSGQVLGERVETLRGMAGLLSGSCHFAWGKPLPDSSTEVPSGV